MTKPGRKAHQWTEAEIKLLGTSTDSNVGKLLGLSAISIWKKRTDLGIPPVKGKSRWNWSPVELRLFQTHTDAEIAKITYRSLDELKTKRAELNGAKAK